VLLHSLPKQETQKSRIFTKFCVALPNSKRITVKWSSGYSWATLNLQNDKDQEREQPSVQPSVMHTLHVYRVCHGVIAVSKWELFFVEPGVKDNEQYYRDIVLSHNVSCYQTHHRWHIVLAAGQFIGASCAKRIPTAAMLNSHQVHFSWDTTAQSWTPLITRFIESYSSLAMTRESKKVEKSSSDWLKSS